MWFGLASNTVSHEHMCCLMGSAFNEGVLLRCQDPCLIQDWSPTTPPTLTLTTLQDPWHYATIPTNPDQPLRTLTWYHCPLRTPTDPQDPQSHFNSYCSVLILLHSVSIFMSPSQSLPFCFWYIAPFQYSCSLIIASTLPSYISASIPLNSCNPL